MDKHIGLNPSVSEIIHLLYELVVLKKYKFNSFLERFIEIILTIIPADSCLIYFYDLDSKTYVLIGSKKPHPKEIGHIVMQEGEGITGWVAKNKQIVAISEKAYLDSRFKSFKELPEDTYESFLSVPIIDDTGVVGVINLQNLLPYTFSKEQIETVACLVKIIASAFAKVVLEQKVNQLENKLEERKIIERAKGILMKIRNINEDDAFRFIRKEAMNKRKSLKEISEAILLVWS
jgi:uroporphyrinogen-III synthase